MTDKSKIPFDHALYDVEHALVMYATSFSTLPAQFIYEKEVLAPLMNVIDKCHIYMIGFQPKIGFVKAEQSSNKVSLTFSIFDSEYTIENNVPDGMKVNHDKELFLTDEHGHKHYLDSSKLQYQLSQESDVIDFEVKYIGQAYGKDGSRNSIDRLIKHGPSAESVGRNELDY